MDVIDALLDFLGSFKNAESLTEELRKRLSLPTKLEPTVLAAGQDGRTVFITGAAGSGKTHLLAGLQPPDRRVVRLMESESSEPHVLVVEDATELSAKERIDILTRRPKSRLATIMAINEGPLRETGTVPGGEVFAQASEILHRGQRGLSSDFDGRRPSVIDMGAFDPLQEGVVADLLGLPELAEAVERVPCACATGLCPRRSAWTQLTTPQVRERVAAVLRVVILADSNWSFRDIWDFIADLTLGGECAEDPPGSPWYWRLFFGSSRISNALREVVEPGAVPLPGVDERLWYADWTSQHLDLLPPAKVLPLSRPDEAFERFLWVKVQVLLMTKNEGLHQLLRRSLENTLQVAVVERQVGPLLEAINRYMVYGMVPASRARLQLWVDHNVERRGDRAHGQIRLGVVEAEDLQIRPSQVVLNCPPLAAGVSGARRFLVHQSSGAVLELSEEKIALLGTRRSFRRSDRRHTDLEWDLYRFFQRILTTQASAKDVGVLICDFQNMKGESVDYAISVIASEIQERA